MDIITSSARFRQRVLKYFFKHGATKASIRFRVSRQSIYRWNKRYDGTWKSLVERSHRPHSHPNQHSEEEKAMIMKRYPYYKDDMIMLWDSLRKSGYERNYYSLVRFVRKLVKPEIEKRHKRKPKPYKVAEYPGQKVQVDVKFVPAYCVLNSSKYYQYTAIDEYSRVVYREIYDEHSTYSSKDFLLKLVKFYPFKIEEIQTDNGTEFTNALLQKKCDHKSLFEEALDELGINYHRIRVATPRHNGKVERQHRIDEKRFYKKKTFYSLEDARTQVKKYNKKSNNIPKICLKFLTPNEALANYKPEE